MGDTISTVLAYYQYIGGCSVLGKGTIRTIEVVKHCEGISSVLWGGGGTICTLDTISIVEGYHLFLHIQWFE